MTFDFRAPHYAPIFRERLERLQRIRDDKTGRTLAMLKLHYRTHPWQLVEDYGMTFDPRLVARGLPAAVPFIPFDKQRDWMIWTYENWRAGRDGLTVKSRDMGISWLAVGLSCAICLTHHDVVIGFGSAKLELVDKLGDPKSIFWKAREFMSLLPPEFRDGWTRAHAPEKLIKFPSTGSSITGEGGDEIGRGGRTSLYFVDEAASIERPMLAEASLSQNTNCRQDLSTPKGRGNPFAEKVFSWKDDKIFRFHWRDDPRKDEEWYENEKERLDPVVLAQEVDMNFDASMTGILIPSAWVQSAIGAHIKLGIDVSGRRRGALDVADEGVDMNCFAAATGILLDHVETWSGKGDDIFGTVQYAFGLSDTLGIDAFEYDADGLGAGVRGDARVINGDRDRPLKVEPFRGSGAVYQPDKQIETASPRGGRDSIERLNKDFFHNYKAQGYWSLRLRFQRTHRCVEAGSIEGYSADDLISIDPELAELGKLTGELSQPTYTIMTSGKIIVDKAPDNQRSPNRADAVMIRYAPRKSGSWMDKM